MTAYLFDQASYSAVQERSQIAGMQLMQVDPVNPYCAEIEHFVDCIEQDRQPFNDGEHALHNLRLVLAGYEPARTGKVVEV